MCNFNVKNSVVESVENTPNRDLIDKVTQTLEYLGSPRGCFYRIGAKCSVTARYGDSNEIGIFLWDGTKNRRLTYEEVKALQTVLTPIVEKHENFLKAQAELNQVYNAAGAEFVSKMGL